MLPGDSTVRVALALFPFVTATDAHARIIEFGVGRDDRAVEILGVKYTMSGLTTAMNTTDRWAAALSENPEHLLTPPTQTFSFDDKAVYGFLQDVQHGSLTTTGAALKYTRTLQADLYGLLRPFRQVAIIWNNMREVVKFRMEVYYRPVYLNDDELEALNRQKGAYRRT